MTTRNLSHHSRSLLAIFTLLVAWGLLTALAQAQATTGAKKQFNVPADTAEKALKVFSAQSGLEVLFPTAAVKGVKTQAVRGEMTAGEALEAMLAGTPLRAIPDAKTGSLTIRREFSSDRAERKGVQIDSAPLAGRQAADDQPVQLSAFEVSTNRDIGYVATNAAEVTRMNTPIKDIPMQVTVFNQEFMEDILAIDTTDVLKFDAGTVWRSENDGFNSRGFSGVAASFLNGFAQPSGGGSQSVANIERVEVMKGPAGILYGQGGFGATVNRISKRPLQKQQTKVRATYGSNDGWRVAFDNTGPVPFVFAQDKLFYRLSLERVDAPVYRKTPSERVGIGPSLMWKISDRTTLILEWLSDRQYRQGGWAFPMRDGNPYGMVTPDGVYRTYASPKLTFTDPSDIRLTKRQVSGTDLRHIFTDNFQFRSAFQYANRDDHSVEIQPDTNAITILRDAVLMARSWRDTPGGAENWRLRNEFVWTPRTGPIQHRILLGHGWDEQYSEGHTNRSAKNFGSLTGANLDGPGRNSATGTAFARFPNITYAQFLANPKVAGYNPNLLLPSNVFDLAGSPPLPPMAQRPALYPDAWTKTVLGNNEFYANNLFSVFDDRVFFSAGLRYTESKRRTLNRLAGSYPFKTVSSNATWVHADAKSTTESYGAVWHLNRDKTLSLYGNLNSSFLPEYREQPDGTPLDPTQGNQKELGVKFTLMAGRVQGLVTYYDLRQDNVYKADPSNPGWFIAYSDQRSTGWEVNLNGQMTENWRMFGSYALTDSRNEVTGVKLAMQERHALALFNRYDFSRWFKGFSASIGSRYGSRRVSDGSVTSSVNAIRWNVPSYWMFDVIASYRLPQTWGRLRSSSIGLNIKNVLDNTKVFYVASGDRWTIQDGRMWTLNFSTGF